MRYAREWAEEQALQVDGIRWDKEDMDVIRGHHPPWIPEDFWHQLCDVLPVLYILNRWCFYVVLCILFVLYILNRWCFLQVWASPRWIAWSRSGRANRSTEVNGVSSRHTGGSIPTEVHRQRMVSLRKLF
jgi:hypothetical protein